jgi:hypothetical protein
MMVGIKCLTWRPVFTVFAETCLQLRISHDALLNNALRSFGGHDLFVRLRQQPCFPLLRLLVRRLRQNAAAAIAVRSAVTDRVSEAWPLMAQPGRSMWRRNPWLFPTLSPEPERLRDHLWAHGFDATRGASNLVSVPAPEGHSSPVRAERLMKEILYLPLHPSAKPRELQRLAGVIRTFAETAHETDSSSVAEHDLIHDLQPRLR